MKLVDDARRAWRWFSVQAMVLLLLPGCATGVQMTDEERIACRNDGCAAFTEIELRQLVVKVFKDGFLRGWTDANKQGGRDL